MSYDVLLSFVVFAEHLNFTRAAKELHITQPALHAQIRKLAESVGVALYRRRGRELVLTDEGRKLASFGREMSVRGREVLSELLARRERGPVVLASGQGAYRYLLGAAIRRFPKDRWPLRAVSMSAPETVDALRDARADVGVAALRVAPEDLDVREVRMEDLRRRIALVSQDVYLFNGTIGENIAHAMPDVIREQIRTYSES